MTITYKCDFCGREFKTKRECAICEISHISYEDAVKNMITAYGKDPCRYCEHSYYVYGIDGDCKYIECKYRECKQDNNCCNFIPTEPFQDKGGYDCNTLQ